MRFWLTLIFYQASSDPCVCFKFLKLLPLSLSLMLVHSSDSQVWAVNSFLTNSSRHKVWRVLRFYALCGDMTRRKNSLSCTCYVAIGSGQNPMLYVVSVFSPKTRNMAFYVPCGSDPGADRIGIKVLNNWSNAHQDFFNIFKVKIWRDQSIWTVNQVHINIQKLLNRCARVNAGHKI